MYGFFAIIGAIIAIFIITAAVYFTFLYLLAIFLSPVFWFIFIIAVIIAVIIFISCRPPY